MALRVTEWCNLTRETKFKFGREVLGHSFLFVEPPFSKRLFNFEGPVMAELNYDFNMNQFKNRLETFKDWPFTEETGSSCTARKVYVVFLTSRQCSSLQNVFCSRCRLKLFFATKLFFLSRQMAEAGFFHSSNDRDPDIARCFVCFKELEGWEPEDNPLYVGTLRNLLVYSYYKLV